MTSNRRIAVLIAIVNIGWLCVLYGSTSFTRTPLGHEVAKVCIAGNANYALATCLQARANNLAALSAIFVFAGLFVSGLGILAVLGTLREAKKQNEFAQRSLAQTLRALRKEFQAYLEIGELKIDGADTAQPRMTIFARNYGRTPIPEIQYVNTLTLQTVPTNGGQPMVLIPPSQDTVCIRKLHPSPEQVPIYENDISRIYTAMSIGEVEKCTLEIRVKLIIFDEFERQDEDLLVTATVTMDLATGGSQRLLIESQRRN